MPSSTSSSELAAERAADPAVRVRAPDGPWLRTWLLTLGLVAAALLAGERAARRVGFRPSVGESKRLWSYERGRVYEANGRALAVLGDSQCQWGFALDQARERLPGWRVAQLAVASTIPFAALRDLAADPAFRGVVVCGLTPPGLMEPGGASQQDYVTHFHRQQTLNDDANQAVSSFMQSRFAVLNPQLGWVNVVRERLRRGAWPHPSHVVTSSGRGRLADYSQVPWLQRPEGRDERLRAHFDAVYRQLHMPPPDDWLRRTADTEGFVRAIQSRGGRVVFVHFPCNERLWELCERLHPKHDYWDRFAAQTAAETVHFRDVPTLRDFRCPDWQHLDYRDAREFTAALLEELTRRRVL